MKVILNGVILREEILKLTYFRIFINSHNDWNNKFMPFVYFALYTHVLRTTDFEVLNEL